MVGLKGPLGSRPVWNGSQRAETVVRSAHLRWAGAALSLIMTGLTQYPRPISTVIPIFISIAIVVYNIPMMFATRVPKRVADIMAIASVVLDFVVCGAWVVMTINDPNASTYVILMIVAVEASILFRWKGTIGFIAAFVPAFAVFYWYRTFGYHLDFHTENFVFRTSIVSLMAVIIGSLSNSVESRREEAEESASIAGREALRLEAVYRVGQRANSSLRRDDVLEAAVDSLGLLFPRRWHGIMLLDNNGTLHLAAGRGEPNELSLKLPLGGRSDAFTTTLVFDDIWSNEHLRQVGVTAPESLRPYTSAVVTPLGVRDVHFGALVSLDPDNAAFGPEDIKLMEALGPQISTALENARLYEEVENLSMTDPLTGLGNRRAFDKRLEEEVERSRRNNVPLSLALVDIDHFKIYNDTHGHQAGDEVLRKLGQALLGHMIRRTDIPFRYGGEEFAILMPSTGDAEAGVAMRRLHEAIRTEPLPLGNHQPGGRLTISAGVTSGDGVDGAVELLEEADLALFAAKQEGRNRTVVYDSALAASLTNWTRVLPQMLAEKSFKSVYQPIVQLGSRALMGYEALARPLDQPGVNSVEGMFTAAQRMGWLLDLDWFCFRAAIEYAMALPAGTDLFVNITLTTLLDPTKDPESLGLVLRSAGRAAEDIVLEINEREAVTDMPRFKRIVSEYRAMGFRFALDDVGEGHSTFEVLAAIEPEFIKIARSMVMGVGEAGAKGAIRALVEFGRTTGACVVAEGIEDDVTAEQMRELGVDLGQGYGLGRPAPLPTNLWAAPSLVAEA